LYIFYGEYLRNKYAGRRENEFNACVYACPQEAAGNAGKPWAYTMKSCPADAVAIALGGEIVVMLPCLFCMENQ
jgi:hypothetical protein